MFSENIPTKVLKDLLTQEELNECLNIEHGGNKALIAMCDQYDDTVFKGYFPLNSSIDNSDLNVHRVNGKLDIMPFTCGG